MKSQMTQAEWIASIDSYAMLKPHRGLILRHRRKGRLFAVACCRRIWHLLEDPRSRVAVEVAGRYAEGMATLEELHAAEKAAEAAYREAFRLKGKTGTAAECAAQFAAFPGAWFAATRASNFAYVAAGGGLAGSGPERAAQANLLRCIFGPFPFAPANLKADIPKCDDDIVASLAQKIYDFNAFDRMPELAQALEQAGYVDSDTLSHCRGPEPHVRGCWVIDLLLGKS